MQPPLRATPFYLHDELKYTDDLMRIWLRWKTYRHHPAPRREVVVEEWRQDRWVEVRRTAC